MNKSALPEKVAVASDLDYAEMRAVLKTLAGDDHALIHKLEIRYKQSSNKYRLLARVTRVDNPKGHNGLAGTPGGKQNK
jgi:hypothetical protein